MVVQADMHVHTEWSWDAPHGSMDRSCQRALQIGLAAIAFTEHAEFTDDPASREGRLNIHGYHDSIERCRRRYPGVRILSGLELGQAHRFPQETAVVLEAGPVDRVLASVHCVPLAGRLTDLSDPGVMAPDVASGLMHDYLAEVLALVTSSQPFEVLAHLDFPKRYWPDAQLPYAEVDYEEEFRAVLRTAARRDAVLEMNTTRGLDPRYGLCPGPTVLRWWYELGGQAVSFGSDAHEPLKVAEGFRHAAQIVEACGFHPAKDSTDYWQRDRFL
jgi:histidinol-phosphatase (PHP family)